MNQRAAGVPRPAPSVLKELKSLEDWELVGRELTKGFYLESFTDAVAFINDVARTANILQHHPDILLSEFSTIRLFIKTNEFGTVTMKDIEFAKRVEGLWKRKWKKREKTTW
jgi:4a-hydroxytetrahydrobiopterin dehydratase